MATNTFLPLPEHAKPKPIGPDGYRVERVGTSGYVVFVDGIDQGIFFETSDSVVVIDAPPMVGDKLPAAIRSVTNKPVSHVILTHDHDDHIGAVTLFAGAELVAHELTALLLRQFPDPKRPAPTITFSGNQHTLLVGGVRFDLIYPGQNHRTGNMVVHVPEQRVAVMVDVFAPGWGPYLNWGNADYIPGLLQAYDAVLALDFDTLLAGHTYRVGTRHDTQISRALFVDLWNWTQQAMGTIPMDPWAAEPSNVWAAQVVWLNRIADDVTPRLVEKYGKQIAAVDAFTHDCVKSVVVATFTDKPPIPAERLT